jgi:peptidylprolyl isomerase
MPAGTGDTVRVHYRGTLDDGSEFDSSYDRAPMEFTLGQGAVIPGFEEGVCGLEIGEKRTLRIGPDDAYGSRNQALVHRVGNDVFEGRGRTVRRGR